jgi:hypothetical protein
MNDIYNKGEIEETIKKTALEIESLLDEGKIDNDKYTKLMFQQLIQGLYLQNVNM